MAINSIIKFINNANSTLILLLLICLFHLNFEVTGNEENYLAWAKAYYDPNWMPGSFVFEHWVGHKYPFELFFGFLLSYLNFETVAFIGRLLAFFLLALGLSRFFKALNFTNLESLVVLVLFLFAGQSFFGREWIFASVEPKVFAYGFLFFALADIVNRNLKKSTLFIIAATYLHVLVAAWFFIYLFATLVWGKTPFRELAKVSGLYIIGTLPLALYLIPNVLGGPSEINGVHLNWIYVYFRLTHHLAPFVDGKLNWEPGGILASLFFFISALIIHFKIKPQGPLKIFNDFNVTIPSFLFAFIIVGYFDRSGDILKYYPFRGAAFFLWFVIVEVVLLTKQYLPDFSQSKRVSRSTLGVLVVFILFGFSENLKHHYIGYYFLNEMENQQWNEAVSFIKKNTNPRSVFFLDEEVDERRFNSFSRKADRDIFVVRKFIPVDKSKWYEWYQRLQIKIDSDSEMVELKKRYGLDYYLTTKPGDRVGKVVFENSAYLISKFPD